jgi:hypothetical protein
VADKVAIEAHDTGTTTTEELKGSPQFIVNEAYQTPDVAGARERLDRVPWPLPLPYDAPLGAVRGCLDYMGVPATKVMEIFNASGDLARSRVESLQIPPREFAILTGATSMERPPRRCRVMISMDSPRSCCRGSRPARRACTSPRSSKS